MILTQFDMLARRVLALLVVSVVIASTCGVERTFAGDDDIVNAFGFEPGTPPNGFSTTAFGGTGKLEGQVNPPGAGQFISPGQWKQTVGATANSAVVESTVFNSGSQAVKVTRADSANTRWAVPVTGYPDYPVPAPGEPVQPCLCITWEMMVNPAAGNGVTTFGPFFGVEAYDDDGNAVGLLGSLGVDATTGEVLYQAPVTGFYTPTGSSVALGAGAWNKFQMMLDYSTHKNSIYLNNALLGTFAYVDQSGVNSLDQFTDADIATVAAAGDPVSLALTGVAYYDNFLVREGTCAVPEPNTLALAAVSVTIAMSMKRRNRRAVC